jgi:hypothetical protein
MPSPGLHRALQGSGLPHLQQLAFCWASRPLQCSSVTLHASEPGVDKFIFRSLSSLSLAFLLHSKHELVAERVHGQAERACGGRGRLGLSAV